jgi:pyrimidine-nucleoside phosphorylase
MERMVAAQGGDARVVVDPRRLEVAPPVAVVAERDGYIQAVDALEIGLAAVAMGAGRTRADQKIDAAVGLSIEAKPGMPIARGQPLAQLHVRYEHDAARVAQRVRSAFRIAEGAPAPRRLVLERVGA